MKEIREKVVELCKAESRLKGTVEADESYFGAKRVKGKRGRGAGGGTIVFGLYKRDKKVYTQIVPNVQKAALQGIIRGHVGLDSVMQADN